jgi:20S proteasome alpha/beta subunit
MTVCVAAMCNQHTIIAASDRMLTAGDVQFEPQQSKIVTLSSSIAALTAGDAGMQAEIFHQVRRDVTARIEADPEHWLMVREVADLYSQYCAQVRLRRAESAILAPLGLTAETYLSRQQQLAAALVQQIATELINFSAPSVAAIITGIDPSGAHIYVADNATITCHDTVGFAAVGAGYWHADSQFMFAGHTRARPMPETLLLTYSAKKRAEVAPGVGSGTDMFMVGPSLGSYFPVGEHVLDELEAIYQATQQTIRSAEQDAELMVNAYVEELTAASTPKEQSAATEDDGREAPVDEEDVGAAATDDGAAPDGNEPHSET